MPCWATIGQSAALATTSITGGSCHKYHVFVAIKKSFVATKVYHSRELPQAPFFVAANTSFAATKVLLRQTRVCVCRNKRFVVTKIYLSRQAYFCRDKMRVVATKMILEAAPAKDKSIPAATKLLSRQAYFCHDKNVFVATKVSLSRQNFCLDKIMFVATSILLSRQTRVCRDKTLGKWVGGDEGIRGVSKGLKTNLCRLSCRRKDVFCLV